MPDEQQSPAIQGVEAKAWAGEVQVVTSHGTASGAGSAGAVGSSIAEAVGNAAGTGAAVGEAGSHNITVPHATYQIDGHPLHVTITRVLVKDKLDVGADRFAEIETRLFALEKALQKPPHGIGHNQSPLAVEDEAEIQNLIALLKEQTPTKVTKYEEVVAATDQASKVGEKIKQHVNGIFEAAAKKVGENLGDNVTSLTWWLGVAAIIREIVDAVQSWLEFVLVGRCWMSAKRGRRRRDKLRGMFHEQGVSDVHQHSVEHGWIGCREQRR